MRMTTKMRRVVSCGLRVATRNCPETLSTLVICFCLALPSSLAMGNTKPPILDLINENDSILVADHTGHVILAKNEVAKRIPASTLKLLTVLAAFHFLGEDYRFTTEFYTDGNDNVKIKGYGDPLLISEILENIASLLADRITRCNSLIVDNSFFSKEIAIPGVLNSTNPYDAPLSALSVNFNTVFCKRDHKGRVISAEPQTPIIPYVVDKIRKDVKTDRISIFADAREAGLYAGHLISYFLKRNGVDGPRTVKIGSILPQDQLLYMHTSQFTLRNIAEKLFQFSNNFMANQLLVALGAKVFGPPGTLEKGTQAVLDYAHNLLGLSGIRLVEGSGIARQNRLSARDMLIILKKFESHRKLLTKKHDVYYKTGTLHGIQTRAGYIETGDGPFSFVLFLNTFEENADMLLKRIVDTYRSRGERE